MSQLGDLLMTSITGLLPGHSLDCGAAPSPGLLGSITQVKSSIASIDFVPRFPAERRLSV